MNLKSNPVGMGMLSIPFPLPFTPMTTRLQVNQLPRIGVRFKRTMAGTQIGIRQRQGGNGLTAMGTTDFRAKNRVLQGRIHHGMVLDQGLYYG
jgi:hypothetical protein